MVPLLTARGVQHDPVSAIWLAVGAGSVLSSIRSTPLSDYSAVAAKPRHSDLDRQGGM